MHSFIKMLKSSKDSENSKDGENNIKNVIHSDSKNMTARRHSTLVKIQLLAYLS